MCAWLNILTNKCFDKSRVKYHPTVRVQNSSQFPFQPKGVASKKSSPHLHPTLFSKGCPEVGRTEQTLGPPFPSALAILLCSLSCWLPLPLCRGLSIRQARRLCYVFPFKHVTRGYFLDLVVPAAIRLREKMPCYVCHTLLCPCPVADQNRTYKLSPYLGVRFFVVAVALEKLLFAQH